MRLWVNSSMRTCLKLWILLASVEIFFTSGIAFSAGTRADLDQKLAAGEIIVSVEETPGKSVKCAEMVGIVEAPPEIVWQVISDVNNYKNFMPRTRNNMAVAPEKIPLILHRNDAGRKPSHEACSQHELVAYDLRLLRVLLHGGNERLGK